MHQIDVLEHPVFQDVIVLQNVLDELRHLSVAVHNRVRIMIEDKDRKFYVFSNEHHRNTYAEKIPSETPNDRNDRAIRIAARWYKEHIREQGHDIDVILLSDDKGNRAKAEEDGVMTSSVSHYVNALKEYPELIDRVAHLASASHHDGMPQIKYEDYMSRMQIAALTKIGQITQGTFNIASHNYLEGSIMGKVDGKDRVIYLLGRENMNRAVQGDVVAVKILPKEEWRKSPSVAVMEDDEEIDGDQETKGNGTTDAVNGHKEESNGDVELAEPTGKVVGIIRKSWRPYCGYVEKKTVRGASDSTTPQNVFFRAVDRRIPKIKFRTRQAHSLVGKRIIVAIDEWSKDSIHPIGHFVKILGEAGDASTETEILLLEHDVPYQEFTKQVLKDLPPEGESWTVKEEHLKGRRDLRNYNICSIDPPGCTDIDDALHAQKLPNGNIQVGVHIADVTHFVHPGMPMDKEAASRGTTVYLVDKRIDMLPGLLGTNLCSLRSNVERLAFSCIWEMTPDAEVISVEYTKSVIRSKHSFTYEEAQNRIDDPNMADELTQGVRLLNSLAKKLRKRRFDNGALTLASPEVRFSLERDSQDPVDVEMKELKETNALVEEFMLLANIYVAQKIYTKFPESSLLRNHRAPPDSNFDELKYALSQYGLELHHANSKEFAESLDKAVLDGDPYFNELVRCIATRCMMQAQYICSGMESESNFHHYGLATNIYTHFTSPIRRYSDVNVHRLLAAAINPGHGYGKELTDKASMKELCDVLNYRHRMAQQAARGSVELFTNRFFKNKIEQVEAYVIKVLKNGFAVLVPKYGIEGLVYASAGPKQESPFEYNAQTMSLENAQHNVKIRIFNRVIVQLTIEEIEEEGMRQKLKMSLVEPFIHGLSVPLKLNDASKEGKNSLVEARDMMELEEESLDKDEDRDTKRARIK
ncbi:hypothetical protein BZG36_05343 [Bifiguratus adelaidae]|uniref:Ribosomal RNA-processing protein 44 n=1 Tax=Bifiguratus adelaidae TaxID=1938954 RepID=A0A261XT66_9FUNG|nr:hypothetical protein BZG36_05343 [Bifiguratus adelaidae]